jgi:hypothetical protein
MINMNTNCLHTDQGVNKTGSKEKPMRVDHLDMDLAKLEIVCNLLDQYKY